MNAIKLVWQIPLSIASWLFFHVMKVVLGQLYTFALSRMTSEAREWQVFSRATISRPFVLPIIATKGPRWNTQAVVFTAGPLAVKASLAFEVATAQASAKSWSIVLYANPGYETVASIESFSVPAGEQWHEIKLAPGKYSINARYYGLSDAALAPAVRVDGVDVVPAKPVPRDSNDFYGDLSLRGNFFYASLHYYVFHMLRWQRWLPDSFVKREYLPAGDPGTIFRYGFILGGECLDIETYPELLHNYDLYLTFYDRRSFPVASETIRDPVWRTSPATTNGYYLFRVRRKPSIDERYRDDWLKVRRVAPGVAGKAFYDPVSSARR